MAISSYEVMLLQKGKTQKEIAEEIGSHQSHVSDWLNGRKSPNSSSLHKLAKALEVSPYELIKELENIRSKQNQSTQLKNNLDNLTINMQKEQPTNTSFVG
jgi:transcriptional regulator with XRE-family HTH domain